MARVALVVASYEYQDPSLRQLVAPGSDAESLAEVLGNPDIAGFEVRTLINEPHYRVGEAIGDFFASRRHDDLALLYFTGHGLKDDDGKLYLAMPNTRKSALLFTSIGAEQIEQAMTSCKSRRQVLVLDCCFSGAFPAGGLAKADDSVHTLERFSGRGRSILTASDSTQYAWEGDALRGEGNQSVFTRFFVEGLRDGTADLNGDGNITVDELYQYVYDRVLEERPQQRPKKLENADGPTVLASNVKWTLPSHLENAMGSPLSAVRLTALDELDRLYRVGNAVVRSRALQEVRRLANDDSRSVVAAATGWLASREPTSVVTKSDSASADASLITASPKAAALAAPSPRWAPERVSRRDEIINADADGKTIELTGIGQNGDQRHNSDGLLGRHINRSPIGIAVILIAVAALTGAIPPIVTLSTNYNNPPEFWFFQDLSRILIGLVFAILAWRAERSSNMVAVVTGYMMVPITVLLVLDHVIAYARRFDQDQVFRLATVYAYPALLAAAAVVAIVFGWAVFRAERLAWASILTIWGLLGLIVTVLSFFARRDPAVPPIADSVLIAQNLLFTTVSILMWRESAKVPVGEDIR